MKGIRYIVLALVLVASGCAISSQVEPEQTVSATNDVVASVASPIPLEPLPTILPTSTVENVHLQEPVLATKFIFPSGYLKINDIYFIDENNGWSVGRLDWYEPSISSLACCKPKIFNTTDGGKNWKEIETGIPSGILNSITFVDSMTAYAVGQEFFFGVDTTITPNTIILKTTDGGDSWVQVDVKQMSGALGQVLTTHDHQIWSVGMGLAGPQSLILRSTDGLSWKTQEHPSETGGELTAMVFSSEKVGYAVGFIGHDSPNPFIIKTLDGGDSWIKLPLPYIPGRILDAAFQDDTNGYIIGHFGDTDELASTTDGGESWTFRDLYPDVWLSWFSKSNNRLVIFGNCWHTETCSNLIGLFDGNEFFPFETLALSTETITAVGNPMNDGSITFVTNTEPESWDAKYETTFYRYNVP